MLLLHTRPRRREDPDEALVAHTRALLGPQPLLAAMEATSSPDRHSKPRRRSRPRSKNCANRNRQLMAFKRLQNMLADQVRSVQQEIAELERRRSLLDSVTLNSRVQTANHSIKVTQDLFRVFAHGCNGVRNPEQVVVATQFLHSQMHRDVMWMSLKGPDLYMAHHQAFVQCHGSIQLFLQDVQVPHMEQDNVCQVRAEGIMRFRINRVTLARFFPAALEDEQLVQQLIGKEYTTQHNKLITFRDGLIVSHEPYLKDESGCRQWVPSTLAVARYLRDALMAEHDYLPLESTFTTDIEIIET